LLIYFNNSIDANGDNIRYKTERLSDGRKEISYEVMIVGMFIFYYMNKKN
jgi:hypothetical protein